MMAIVKDIGHSCAAGAARVNEMNDQREKLPLGSGAGKAPCDCCCVVWVGCGCWTG
jgi:hypothetical protein